MTNLTSSDVPTSQETIGLVGVGLLGTAIAERLLQHGHSVWAFDPAANLDVFQSAGGRVCQDVTEVASGCEKLIFSLPDSTVVHLVVDEMRSALGGHTIVDTTTGNPDDAVAISCELANVGVDYLDATVAGSSQMLREHRATMLVGGARSAFRRCVELLDVLAAKAFYLGESGSGAKMKLVVNLAIGLNRAVLAEALAFGEAFGFDSHQVVDVLVHTPAHSDAMDAKGDKMANREFAPQARLQQHLKDVKLILESAKKNGAQVPMSALHLDLLQSVVDAGLGDLDNSAIVNAFRAAKNGRDQP